ncbi:MAG: restriction endonuclease subunit S [Phascolarctobacterium sp.]
MKICDDLRQAVLQAAIQGKLTTQRKEDGDARELLKQIAAEKAQLIKDKKIKKEKPLPEIAEEEIPFEVPENWVWCRLGSLIEVNPKNVAEDNVEAGFIPMALLDSGFVSKHSFETRQWSKIKKGFTHFADGDLVLAKITPCFQNRKSAIISNLPNGIGAGTTELHVLRDLTGLLDMNFFLFVCKSTYFIDNGIEAFTGTAGQQRISSDFVSNFLISLPPLAEQHRIVAKVEKLMAEIDELEKVENELHALKTAFPGDMKAALLQAAMQGKLTTQHKEDGDARDLLKQIAKEKAQLIKEKKIKKEKPLPEITDDEIPFDVPENWVWCRLGDIFQHNTGKALNSSNKDGVNLSYITTSNLYWNRFEIENLKTMPFTFAELEKCTITKGDLLVCEGGDFGRTAIWNYDYDMRIQNHIHRLRAYLNVNIHYFYYIFYFYKTSGQLNGKGISIQGLSSNALHCIMVPLPPLAEQHRIVAKLEKLMPLCDGLVEE